MTPTPTPERKCCEKCRINLVTPNGTFNCVDGRCSCHATPESRLRELMKSRYDTTFDLHTAVELFIRDLLSQEREALVGEIESKAVEWGTIGEKADSFFMKGEPSDGYSLEQAASDSDRYCHMAEAADLLLALLKSKN